MKSLKIFLVAGARPNFMKIAPLYEELKKHGERFEPVIVHTGQHYDANMSKVFFEDLELPQPDFYLDVGSATHAEQTAEVMKRFEPLLLAHRPHVVLVVGDVNSTLAAALVAKKVNVASDELSAVWARYERYLQDRGSEQEGAKWLCEESGDSLTTKQSPDSAHGTRRLLRPAGAGLAESAPFGTASEPMPRRQRDHATPLLAHVEAGERSFDFSMPEEINRVATDVLSDLLFTTCEDSDANLIREGLDPRTIFRVGNIMVDSLQRFLNKAERSNILTELNRQRSDAVPEIRPGEFVLVTLHRAGNVDHPETLRLILSALLRVSQAQPVVFPMHPRTRKLLQNLDADFRERLQQSAVLITEPVGYLDFLHLQRQARLVLTDSGGVQVETSYLGVPCVTLRPTTEWRITLRHGTNRLAPLEEDAIVEAARQASRQADAPRPAIPLWDGQTAARIVSVFASLLPSEGKP